MEVHNTLHWIAFTFPIRQHHISFPGSCQVSYQHGYAYTTQETAPSNRDIAIVVVNN